jgi:cytoskeleton protein RodZ
MASNSTQTPHRRGAGEGPEDTVAAERRRRDGVGALLRQTRIAYGADPDSTAAALCIRLPYLIAIEQGDYAALPGEVYALGFIRAYAVHLGLDGDEAVRRFKNEAADFERPRELSFPMPLAKRSVPGGTMVLAALVLAICGYGLWYYLSTGDHARPDQVSAVPTQFLPPAPANAAPAAALPAAPPLTDNAALPPDGTSAAEVAAAVQSAAAPPAIDALPSSPAVAATPLPALSDTTSDAAVPATQHSLVTTMALPAPAANPLALAPVAPPAPAAAPQVAAVPAAPHIFGAVSGPSRIAIRAANDSWLQVRDRSDAVVAQRLLHQGDLYRVPEQPGLVLRTGNASALEITVDGKPIKQLGGTVRSNILLDPDRLVAGTAAVD